MAHNRLRQGKAAIAAAGAACALVVATPAHAGLRPPPRDAPVVAGPTASGARLVAFDRKGKLCTAFLQRGEPRRFVYPECSRPSGLPRDFPAGGSVGFRPRRIYHWSVVAPEVAEVEIVYRGGRSVRGPTSDGAGYEGRYAGKVRFLLLEDRRPRTGADESYAKLYDSDGALLAVVDIGYQEIRIGHPVELARGSTGGRAWSLRAFRTRRLAPLPGDEERFVAQSCVELRRPVRGGLFGRLTQTCASSDNPRDRDSFALQQHCGAIGYTAVGTVSPEVRAVVAVLGDGRVRRLPLRRLPESHGDGRAFALVLGRSVAVRRLVALTQDGRRREIVGSSAPGSVRCGDHAVLLIAFGYEPVTPRGPIGFTVYDDGLWICATLGRPTLSPAECHNPPIEPYEARILLRREEGRGVVAGVLPRDVTRVVVELASGERVPVETQADGFYAGRYAGLVRFFTLELEPGQRVSAIRLFDARGRLVLVHRDVEEPTPTAAPRLVVGGPPGLRLRAQWFGLPSTPRYYLCVSLGEQDCGFASTLSANLTADCKPRRLVLWGLLPTGRTAVTVETDRGDFAARVRPLPHALREDRSRLGDRYRAVSAYVVALPPGAKPTALVISGRRSSRRRLALPPARAQCGYSDFLPL